MLEDVCGAKLKDRLAIQFGVHGCARLGIYDRKRVQVPVTKMSSDFRSMFGSNAVESAPPSVGLSLLSLDSAICSGSTARAVTGAISWMWPDDRCRSCSSG